MPTTSDYLTQLETDRQNLISSISAKGVQTTGNEKFTDMPDLVSQISSGGSSYDWSAIGYSSEPSFIQNSYNLAKDIYDNWDNSITDCSNKYKENYSLLMFPLVDTSNVTNTNYMFQSCTALQKVPQLDLSKIEKSQYMFSACNSLKEVGNIVNTKTSGSVSMSYMFNNCFSLKTAPTIETIRRVSIERMFYGCSSLENVPVFNLGTGSGQGAGSIQLAFSNCPNLTNESLNNIMGTIKNLNYKYVYAYFGNSAVYKKPKGRNDHKPTGILSHPSIDSAIYYSLSANYCIRVCVL